VASEREVYLLLMLPTQCGFIHRRREGQSNGNCINGPTNRYVVSSPIGSHAKQALGPIIGQCGSSLHVIKLNRFKAQLLEVLWQKKSVFNFSTSPVSIADQRITA
jgi:hypothetical protein